MEPNNRTPVVISEPSKIELPLIAGWLSDPTVNKWLFSEFRGKQFGERQIAAMMLNPRNRLWIIKSGTMPIGLVGLAGIDPQDKTTEVWCLRAPNTESRGEVSEGLRAATQLAFRELGLNAVRASVMANNAASRRMVERCGFRFVGMLRRAMSCDGVIVDRVLYDILPEEVPETAESAT